MEGSFTMVFSRYSLISPRSKSHHTFIASLTYPTNERRSKTGQQWTRTLSVDDASSTASYGVPSASSETGSSADDAK